MRRKNMLALGLSLVFCATAPAVPLYANLLDHQEITVSEEKEKNENQAENPVEDTAEYKNTDSEEGSKESLADFPEETKNSDSEVSAEETENAEVSAEETESTEEAGMVKPLSSGYSGFRMANANGYTLEDKILTMNLVFGKVEYAARDHMKVVRDIPLKVSGLTIRGKKDIVWKPSEEICKVLPDRIVQKKRGGVWTVYTEDYFTPGEYRYIYTLAMGKNSPYYFLPQETPDNDKPFTFTKVVIGDRFAESQRNSSIRVNYSKSASGEDPKYKYYSIETESFSVEEAQIISQVYLNSSFDIHKAKVGDPMNSVTLNVEKIVLKNGTTVLNPGSSEQPFLINMYGDYSNDLNRFRLFLESYTNAAGENGNVRKAPEGTPLPAGRYQVRYLVQLNFMIDKYRFLVEGTDDRYVDGTEFYVNNERYSNKSLRLQEGSLTSGAEVLSPYFEPAKVAKQENYSGSSGGSSSSSGSGGSGGSSGGGSGSFKVSSSVSGQVLGVDRSLSGGQWIQDEKGWWYKRADGSYPKNSWGYEAYNGKSYWYYFLDSGYMATGWVDVNGSKYYLFPNSDGWKGRMLTGWQWIDGACYYLDLQGQNEGALYRNTTTPDGYAVDSEGRWVVNGAVQKQ
ncbi:N-acetylmuramoyl-L-alanine amidase family protein [Oribacterium sinus]